MQLNVWRQRLWGPGVHDAGVAHLRHRDLRHTAVALWMAAGAKPKEVAARARHTSVSLRWTATGSYCRDSSNA